jgi:hypothetical protein
MIKKISIQISSMVILAGLIGLSCEKSQDETDNQDLVAYYPFNGNANDLSKYANHGINYGALPDFDRHSIAQQSYYFDGTDTIIVPSGFATNFGIDDFTISFWIKSSFGEDYMVMGKCDKGIPNGGPGWAIQVENTKTDGWGIRLDLWDGTKGRCDIVSDTSAIDNNWHFVAFSVKRSVSAELYIDGIKKDEGSVVGIGNISNDVLFRIGKRPDWQNLFKGNLDEIRIYNRALSENEIAALYDR